METIRCTRCEEKLMKVEWLELSNTDGKFYQHIPDGHISQGYFPFGVSCCKTQLNEKDNDRTEK